MGAGVSLDVPFTACGNEAYAGFHRPVQDRVWQRDWAAPDEVREPSGPSQWPEPLRRPVVFDSRVKSTSTRV